MNVNKVFIGGNLTRDPELRYTPSGAAVAEFGIAVNRRWKDGEGNDMEEVTFVDCAAWTRTAEVIAQYFRKGNPIFVEGRLKLDQWEDKQSGSRRSKLKVNVIGFQFCGETTGEKQEPRRTAPKRDNGTDYKGRPKDESQAPEETPVDDDVPF